LKINESIFKAYDIRGIYPEDINEEIIYLIGKAFVKLLKEENPGKNKLTIVVGRDMRLSSPELTKSLMKGMIEMGADVVDLGLASTPTFYYSVGKLGLDGGIQVSASHNPKEWNGLKVVRKNAYPVGLANGLDKVRDYCIENDFEKSDNQGIITKNKDILSDLVKYSMDFYDFSNIKPFKVVADVANAMSSPDFVELFKELPCELIKMNFELDGTFPAHQADPMQEQNVVDIKKKVLEEKADIGIATDGDGDRYFFIDNKGEMVEPAIIRGMLAEYVLRYNPGANIGYDIRPGMITKDMIVESGGKPFITKVGHSLIKIDFIKHDAPFSGESSGHFFFKTEYGTYEMPLITTLIILKEMSEKGKPISEIIKPLQRYFHSGEINNRVSDPKKIFRILEEKYSPGAKNISKLDGILIEHEDYWFNVRGSNTEPLIRLNLEARKKDVMEQKTKEILEIIKS